MLDTTDTAAAYDPYAPAVQQDPYPYYRRLREQGPVRTISIFNAPVQVITRYTGVHQVLHSPRVFSNGIFSDALFGPVNPFPADAPGLISLDPPGHTRLRGLVNRAFSRRRISSFHALVRSVVDETLDAMAAAEQPDLVRDFAVPFPSLVIAEILGVPRDRLPDFRRWMESIIAAMNWIHLTETDYARIRVDFTECTEYFRGRIESEGDDADTLLNALIRAREGDATLTADEIISMVFQIVIGGSETTTNLIANAIWALAENPEQAALLAADRSSALIPRLVEETLRYESPIQGLFRNVTEDVTVDGVPIAAGTIVLVLFASANRDEAKFPDGDRFDLSRDTDGHLGFGIGTHFCLGSQLARMEIGTALDQLLTRFPDLHPTTPSVERLDSGFVRGIKALPVAWS